MRNSFFDASLDAAAIRQRVLEVTTGKVGFYSVGLYPASLAYNCAMQNADGRLLLAPRPGRHLLGAFSDDALNSMDREHVDRVVEMGRVKMLLTGGGKDQERDAYAKLALAEDLQQQGAFDEAIELYFQAVELYRLQALQVSGHD